ncbi:unnamed protein product [Amoebophrya sp. A120]|nr:unnamed protein product [Amoebophrya sp. A120]|eukprot:GSA120T00025153001.1
MNTTTARTSAVPATPPKIRLQSAAHRVAFAPKGAVWSQSAVQNGADIWDVFLQPSMLPDARPDWCDYLVLIGLAVNPRPSSLLVETGTPVSPTDPLVSRITSGVHRGTGGGGTSAANSSSTSTFSSSSSSAGPSTWSTTLFGSTSSGAGALSSHAGKSGTKFSNGVFYLIENLDKFERGGTTVRKVLREGATLQAMGDGTIWAETDSSGAAFGQFHRLEEFKARPLICVQKGSTVGNATGTTGGFLASIFGGTTSSAAANTFNIGPGSSSSSSAGNSFFSSGGGATASASTTGKTSDPFHATKVYTDHGRITIPGELEGEGQLVAAEIGEDLPSLPDGQNCLVCHMDDPEPAFKLKTCGHVFHKACLFKWFEEKRTCPVCKAPVGIVVGQQPRHGTMSWQWTSQSLVGETGFGGSILVLFSFKQGRHPTTNASFAARTERCYLPYNYWGIMLLELFKVAFKRRVMFGFGTRMTTGTLGPTFNVHLKTSPSGGQQYHGYPDDTYFERCLDTLRDSEISTKDVPQRIRYVLCVDQEHQDQEDHDHQKMQKTSAKKSAAAAGGKDGQDKSTSLQLQHPPASRSPPGANNKKTTTSANYNLKRGSPLGENPSSDRKAPKLRTVTTTAGAKNGKLPVTGSGGNGYLSARSHSSSPKNSKDMSTSGGGTAAAVINKSSLSTGPGHQAGSSASVILQAGAAASSGTSSSASASGSSSSSATSSAAGSASGASSSGSNVLFANAITTAEQYAKSFSLKVVRVVNLDGSLGGTVRASCGKKKTSTSLPLLPAAHYEIGDTHFLTVTVDLGFASVRRRVVLEKAYDYLLQNSTTFSAFGGSVAVKGVVAVDLFEIGDPRDTLVTGQGNANLFGTAAGSHELAVELEFEFFS